MPSPTPPMPDPDPERPAAMTPHTRRRTAARHHKPRQRPASAQATDQRRATPPELATPARAQQNEPDDPTGDWDSADLVAAGLLDLVPGDPPVPVSIWRATSPPEPPRPPATGYRALTPALAARLLAIYTDPTDTVLDTTADPAIAGAAGAGGRQYLPLLLPPTRPVPHLRGQVALILLRWPPTGPVSGPGRDGEDLHPRTEFDACADLLQTDGHTVVILAPPEKAAYRDHARILIPAARQAGLGYLQHLLVITTPTNQSSSVPKTEQAPARGLDSGAALARAHAPLDLLVFILRHVTRH